MEPEGFQPALSVVPDERGRRAVVWTSHHDIQVTPRPAPSSTGFPLFRRPGRVSACGTFCWRPLLCKPGSGAPRPLPLASGSVAGTGVGRREPPAQREPVQHQKRHHEYHANHSYHQPAVSEGQPLKVHAEEPRHERDGHKERTDNGQHLHHFIDPIRGDGQICIERTTSQLPERFVQIHQPYQVIVYVPKEHAILRINDVIVVARQLIEHFTLRANNTPEMQGRAFDRENRAEGLRC